MCYYCHILKKNPTAPTHRGVHCLDRSNTHSKVPMAKRTYDRGQSLLFPLPSAPPAEDLEEPTRKTRSTKKKLFTWFTKKITAK